MMTETYGDKPLVFAFDGDGEQYMIGSEVNIFHPIRIHNDQILKGGQLFASVPWSPVQEVPWVGEEEPDQR